MPRLPFASPHHDPYWEVDGASARRSRIQRRSIRWSLALLTIVTIVVVVIRLPVVDPEVLTTPAGRPILAAAILSLLGASVLLALARIRYVTRR